MKHMKPSTKRIVFFALCLICIIYVAVMVGVAKRMHTTDHTGSKEPGEITHEPTPKHLESIQEPTAPEPTIISLGEYRLTAYCACEKCCGYWATVRPLDSNGKPIVYTANQSIAKQGVTVAADTNVLSFGTKLLIDGHEYIVQDRGGAIKGNRIDIYFESHEEALAFGVQYKEVFKIEGDA